MTNGTTRFVLLGLIGVMIVVGIVLYPQLPSHFASHWNAAGEVNGYMNTFWGVFLMPSILIGMFVLYLAIPRLDPMRANIESFGKHYNSLWVVISLFLVYVHGLSLWWNLGHQFNFSVAMIPPFAVLWALIGVFLERSKRNWFIGIRTPWTLSSDIVWEKTHRLGGVLFKATAVIIGTGMWFPQYIFWFMFVPILTTVCVTTVYSYVEYQKGERGEH